MEGSYLEVSAEECMGCFVYLLAMKWMLVLFATYMLALPCIPCNAAEVCCEKDEACVVEDADCATNEKPCASEEHSFAMGEPVCKTNEFPCAAEEHSRPEEVCNHHEDPCSEESTDEHEHSATCPCCPSFSCNTCHSIVVASLVLEDFIIPAHSFDNIPFTDKPLAHFPAIIWQPPKGLC